MPKPISLGYGHNLIFTCKGDKAPKNTKARTLTQNEPIAFIAKCAPKKKKKKRRKSSAAAAASPKARSASAAAKATSPKDNKSQTPLQALIKKDHAAFPHPILDGSYLGIPTEILPPIKVNGKRNPERRNAVEEREINRDYLRRTLNQDPRKQRIHNLMIAGQHQDTSLPHIIQELQKKKGNKKLSKSLIAAAEKLQKERISTLYESQSQQAWSPSPEMKEISSAVEGARPSPDDFAMSVSTQGRGGGGRRFQKTRSKRRRRTKRKKRKRKKKKTRQKKKRRTTKKRQH